MMTQQTLTINALTRCAYGEECPELLELEEDPDAFDREVCSLCDDDMLLDFAADRSCAMRQYFAQLLATSLCWVYRVELGLPFHFSRLRGLMAKAEFIGNAESLAEAIHKKSAVIDRMRETEDDAIQALYKQIMDFRHRITEHKSKLYYELIRDLHSESLQKFQCISPRA